MKNKRVKKGNKFYFSFNNKNRLFLRENNI